MKNPFEKFNYEIQQKHWPKIIELMPMQAIKVMGYWVNLRRGLNESKR